MKYNITFRCGHTETIELYGPYKNRERRIKYLEENYYCEACYLNYRKKQLENDIKNKNWCILDGTTKQVLWAHDIRKKIVSEIENLTAHSDEENQSKQTKKIINGLKRISDTAFWIENRYSTLRFFAEKGRDNSIE